MTKKILIAVADGIEELEAIAVIDCLGRAGAEITTASVDKIQISTCRKIKITADCLISDCKDKIFDLIVLPGGLPGAEHFAKNKILIEMLKQQQAAGRYYAAICASPAVVFEPAGLLDGKRAVCYPAMAASLKDKHISGKKVFVDGNCITSQGPGTAAAFALKLVELLFGKNKSNEIAKAMLFEGLE